MDDDTLFAQYIRSPSPNDCSDEIIEEDTALLKPSSINQNEGMSMISPAKKFRIILHVKPRKQKIQVNTTPYNTSMPLSKRKKTLSLARKPRSFKTMKKRSFKRQREIRILEDLRRHALSIAGLLRRISTFLMQGSHQKIGDAYSDRIFLSLSPFS